MALRKWRHLRSPIRPRTRLRPKRPNPRGLTGSGRGVVPSRIVFIQRENTGSWVSVCGHQLYFDLCIPRAWRRFEMANLLYKDHLITVVARTDEISTFWIPMVDISWDTD